MHQTGPARAELEKKVAALEATQTSLNTHLTFEINALKLRADATEETLNSEVRSRSASFAPDEKGFQAVHTDYGVFLSSRQDIRPDANGFKATFRLGNALSLDFDGAVIELRWGPKRPSEFKTIRYSDWIKQFKTSK